LDHFVQENYGKHPGHPERRYLQGEGVKPFPNLVFSLIYPMLSDKIPAKTVAA
jgi:hypothetical protein